MCPTSQMSVQISNGHTLQNTTSTTSGSRYICPALFSQHTTPLLFHSMLCVCCVFQLVCMGLQTFSRNGELMEERTELKHGAWSTSRGRESYPASKLLPNCRYTCRLFSVARDRQSDTDKSPQVTFHTLPGSKF